ncbi:alpha/beta hydrolase [Piscinibacter sakaiensis]|uniref:alpha/beta fold hydrolase n=1 Tax=Piscinibacter sakaiensis TaxID=1547922 RepID=UPI0006B692F3|nr:alpha/beta hydrolase [Piscinibacter sakaiensis]
MSIDPLRRNNVHARGAGETLVFGHGFGTDQRVWTSVADALAPGHRLVLLDHVGFGGSDPAGYDPARHARLEGYADDLLEVLAALGPEPVTYVGHSAGALIGLLASIAAPARFRRLVLLGMSPRFIDAPPDYVGGFAAHEIEAILDLMERDQVAWAGTLAPLAIGEDGPEALVQRFDSGLRALDPLFARRFARLVFTVDARDRLPQATVPSLAVHCTRDSIVPIEVGRYLRDHLPGCTLHEIEGSGHCPHLSHPRETVEAIAAYLT